jgi:hypothetical protein
MKENICLLPSKLSLSNLNNVSTPFQNKINEFHLLNVCLWFFQTKINLNSNLINIKNDVLHKS